jgi:hypothetical protein
MPISRGQMPRQMYGLGSLVKSITKGVKSAVKGVVDVAKSPLGLAALGIGGAGLFGMGPLSQLASTKLGTTLAGLKSSPLFTGASKFFGGEKTLGKTAAMFGLGGLGAAALEAAGLDPDNPNEMPRDIESLKGYLRSGYLKLNPGAKPEDVDAFVEANTREYSANGGRIGYQIGGDVAYDATNTDIYGSSAITVTPDTVMGLGGNQIQDRMGKPGIVSPITGMPLPPGGFPAVPATSPAPNRPPDGYIDTPANLGTPMGPTDMRYRDPGPGIGTGLIDRIDMTRPPGTPSGNGALTVMPRYNDPLPKDQLLSGFEEYKKNNPPGFGTAAMVPVTLPGGYSHDFSGSAEANAFRKYLESIGQAPYQGRQDPGMLAKLEPLSPLAATAYSKGGRIGYNIGSKGPDDLYSRSYKRVMELMDEGYDFGSAVKKYMEEEKERENKSYGGRIGYDGGTDFQKWLEGKQKFDKGQNAEQLYREYLEEKRRQKVAEQKTMAANGGRIGYAFGDVVDQASGIMGLPQRVNQAGVKELDLRDSGGFIPPVGVKEKADDIPAMLSNNEFVFTADAVRNMGDGNVNKGAQRMYDMMKYLEKGGRV